MRLSIPRAELKEAAAGFAKIVAGRQTLPILGCVRFDLDGTRVVAQATNLDETAHYGFADAKAEGGGTLVLPLQALKDLCKGDGRDVVELESAEDDAVSVANPVAGHVLRRTVPGHPAADWPSTGSAIPTQPAPGFLPTYRRVAPFALTDASRPVLNTVFVDVSGKGSSNATLVACDGRRLTACNSLSLPLGKDGVAVPVTKFLAWTALGDDARIGAAKPGSVPGVPANTASTAAKAATSTATNAPTWFALDAGPWSYRVRTPDGVYPNWRQVLPEKGGASHCFVFADPDVEALRKLLPAFPGDESLAVVGEAGGVAVAGRNRDDKSEARVPLTGGSAYEGQGVRVLVNRHFLLDALEAGFRNFGFHGGLAPLRSDDGRGGVHVLMPLRTGREAAPTPVQSAAPEATPAPQPAPEAPPADPVPIHQPTPKETPMTTEPQADTSALAKLQTAVDACKARVREANQALADVAAAIKDAVREDRLRRNEVESVRAGLQKLQAIRV